MEQFSIVKVEWSDSNMYIGQASIEAEFDTAILTSVGFLIQEDEEKIVLAAELTGDECRRVLAIPKVNVIETINLIPKKK